MEKMEQKIKIFYSEYGKTPTKFESAPFSANLAEVGKFYEKLGESQKNSFDRFAEFWRNEGFEALCRPAARVVTMAAAEAEENFGADILPANDRTSDVVMMVWTIGSSLERRCEVMTSGRGGLTNGLLLDVAGSIVLSKMHASLFAWTRDICAKSRGKFISGEFYPGLGSMSQDLMERVVSLGDTEETIGVGASNMSLLRPRKSQCSFITLGGAGHEPLLKADSCVPCAGKKCLYYQLGGCHMQARV